MRPDQATVFVANLLKEGSVDSIEGDVVVTSDDQKEELLAFFKGSYTALKPGGKISVRFTDLPENHIINLESFAKLHGFSHIAVASNGIEASKVAFGAAPAKIKKKQGKQNPWAKLEQDEELINEDDLMKDSAEVEVKKFCGEKDIMQGAKPCANCSCGLKE